MAGERRAQRDGLRWAPWCSGSYALESDAGGMQLAHVALTFGAASRVPATRR